MADYYDWPPPGYYTDPNADSSQNMTPNYVKFIRTSNTLGSNIIFDTIHDPKVIEKLEEKIKELKEELDQYKALAIFFKNLYENNKE